MRDRGKKLGRGAIDGCIYVFPGRLLHSEAAAIEHLSNSMLIW